MKLAVHGRQFGEKVSAEIQRLLQYLREKEIEVQVSDIFSKCIPTPGIESFTRNGKDLQADYILSLGGDGTFLETVTIVGKKNIPVIGINTGRLGFLADTPIEEAEKAVDALLANSHTVEERTLIRVDSDCGLFGAKNFGLNEFAIMKQQTSSMITVHTYLDGEYLNSYWADGLIVATPTGSTGYSLSCGGPIITPKSAGFVITPVSPHNLNVRPMVVPDSGVISFEIEGRSKHFLTSLDSRSETVKSSVKIAVRKEDFTAKIVRPNDKGFFNTLRKKLSWGLDIRN